MYRCSATLSFTCTADGPQPAEVGCVEQSMAYVECLDTAPCLGHCDAAVAAGCGGSGEQACLDACEAELEVAGRKQRVDQNHVKYFLDLKPGEKRFVPYSVTYKRRKVGPELNQEKKREPL